jgi:deferrochelatase/peroxidase EfeB
MGRPVSGASAAANAGGLDMNQVMITIVASLAPADIPAARAAIDRLGNPAAAALKERLDVLTGEAGVHFMSLHALPSFTRGRGHLVLEFSGDGDGPRAINQIVSACGAELATVFALATDWRDGDMTAYLTSHMIQTGFGLGASPGLGHSGAPGMSVGRIRQEAALAAQISEMLARQPGGMSALSRLEDVRRQIGAGSPDITPGESKPAFTAASLPAAVIIGLIAFARTYLWPFAVLLLAWCLLEGARWGVPARSWRVGLMGAWQGLRIGLPVLIGLLAALAIGFYLGLRRLETSDWLSTRAPERRVLHEIIERENVCAQNHMVSLTELKAGWLRRFAVRLVFFAVATVGPRLYKPGYLGPIGTIHFARWVTIPGTRDFIFLSNYGGSWEAYLEDFITLAHLGLTGVWSNTVGFPVTNNLVFGGATDGERFKRYARQSMTPTRFWYSAYPELTTDMIRANSGIRRGLSGAMTEDDAQTWLCYFGSALRPDDRLVTSEIQSLLFGGLGFLNYSALTLWKSPDDTDKAAAWLKEISAHIAYNDGRRLLDDDAVDAVVQVAISAAGLKALGLPDEGLETFPPAFLDDMTNPYRARILGDSGANALEYWWWGQAPSDLAVIVYGQTEPAFQQLKDELNAIAARHGARHLHTVDMKTYDRDDNLEPFGFADGGSQPVIRGTYKGLRSGDPLHLVEPGEFILGYPDNRGNLPPVPSMPALYDPENQLPVLGGSTDFSLNSVNNPRDLGFNGSYLVIRQLEQDPEAFNGYLQSEAARLKQRLGPPYQIDADFLAAKLMGRWRNGAPLVRSPYSQSASPEIIMNNSFELGFEDPEGLRCPFGAHIRRANPRDSLNPGSTDQIAITNRHRIMRIGRKYAPGAGQKPGLLFMCLNGDLERQFEFIQQTWVLGNVISLSCPITLSGERDPVLGGAEANTGFTIPTPDGPVKLSPTPGFVTTRGGGYFFLPGKRLINYLAERSQTA